MPSDEWARTDPLNYPELSQRPLEEGEGFGSPVHDRNASPVLSPEKLEAFRAALAEEEAVADLVHPKPYKKSPPFANASIAAGPSTSAKYSFRLVRAALFVPEVLFAFRHFSSLLCLLVFPSSMTTQDGSNAWAVSGKFTLSGKPLLAGDPHMELTSPGNGGIASSPSARPRLGQAAAIFSA